MIADFPFLLVLALSLIESGQSSPERLLVLLPGKNCRSTEGKPGESGK